MTKSGNRMYRCTGLLMTLFAIGCGSTHSTDTSRSATEMLLISNAIDRSIDEFDFAPLRGEKVFLDTKYLEKTVDKEYLIGSFRQHVAAHGAYLMDKREDGDFVIELRAGAVGTDRYDLLVGVPQMNLPAIMPGQPSYIPEIPFIKKSDQQGIAKIGVFVYHRETGRAVWQSGVRETESNAKDTWVLGAGPFRRGSINTGPELAGVDLRVPEVTLFSGEEEQPGERPISVGAMSNWAVDDQSCDAQGKPGPLVEATREPPGGVVNVNAEVPEGENELIIPAMATSTEGEQPIGDLAEPAPLILPEPGYPPFAMPNTSE